MVTLFFTKLSRSSELIITLASSRSSIGAARPKRADEEMIFRHGGLATFGKSQIRLSEAQTARRRG